MVFFVIFFVKVIYTTNIYYDYYYDQIFICHFMIDSICPTKYIFMLIVLIEAHVSQSGLELVV